MTLQNSKTSKRLMEPIKVCTAYMAATLVAYFISPVEKDTSMPLLLILLVGAYILAFYGGYRTYKPRIVTIQDSSQYDDFDVNKQSLQLAVGINLIYVLITLFVNLSSVGISSLSRAITTAFIDSNSLYMAKVESYSSSSTIINAITLLGAPIYTYAMLFGGLCFRKLSRLFRAAYILSIILEAVKWIIVGTNKGIFDLMGLIIVISLFTKWAKASKKGAVKAKKHNIKRTLLIIAGLLFAFYVLNMTIGSRMNSSSIKSLYDIGVTRVNTNNIFFWLFPVDFVVVLSRIFGYFSGGYYGLSLCFEVGWMPTFFVGSSGFVRQYANELLGIDVTSRLYQTRIAAQFSWSATAKWHTMYTWLANDFGLIGVIIVMFILGRLFCKAIHEGIFQGNVYALCIAYQLMMMVFYSSANNQILGSGQGLICLVVFSLLWYSKKHGHYSAVRFVQRERSI